MAASETSRTSATPPGRVPSAMREYRFFIVAGEHSGDVLGGKLMAELNRRLRGRVRYLGVGGEAMEREGLISQFPLHEVAVMGPLSILPRLPRIVKRVYGTVRAGIAAEPDAVIIIDSPEFTHPVAKRIRRARPSIPIIDYVSPSVWAWRPGRARKMRHYIDHVLALLPFEVEAHHRLGGPPCTYTGHPLSERLEWIAALDPKDLAVKFALDENRPVLVVLPGSRVNEVTRLIGPFSDAVRILTETVPGLQVVLPVVPSVRPLIEKAVSQWPCRVHFIEGDDDKFRAFRLADAALAASGTVTLELGICGTPAVVAYMVDQVMLKFRFMLKVPSIVLANLVAGENIYPELLQENCTGEKLAAAVLPLLSDTPERTRQCVGLGKVLERVRVADDTPSERAADIILQLAGSGRQVR